MRESESNKQQQQYADTPVSDRLFKIMMIVTALVFGVFFLGIFIMWSA